MRSSLDPDRGTAAVVLAIDATAAACSVALAGPDGVVCRSAPTVHGHTRRVLALLDAVIAEAGVPAQRIDAIGYGSGPGAFTGLRIACGIAQGLGFGWDRPLVPVDAMRTLALQAALATPVARGRALVALDLRMGEVCRASFELEAARAGGWPEPDSPFALEAPSDALAALDAHAVPGAPLAGDGADAHPAIADWAVARGLVRPAAARIPDAGAVARLARVGLASGRAIDAALATPTYLRDKVALDVGEQAALRAARLAQATR
jgi:tRNA threonylcarbamoyladenosine biosynthesis protein TsaB